ncbi:MAG: AI-2E family transporter [Myxococcaceae bacterium]|nr:AI-2E family transporter [Myxococcaceae bacterium]
MSRSAKRFFIGLMVVTMVLLAFGLRPIFGALLIAAVLASLLWPLQQWLSKKFKGRRAAAAALLVFGVTTLIITPVVTLSAFLVQEVTAGARFVYQTVDRGGVQGLIAKLPAPLEKSAQSLLQLVPDEVKLEDAVNTQGGKAAAVAGSVVAATGTMMLNTALMLIALYFFLLRGEACVQWLDSASPLRKGQSHELLVGVKKVANSVVKSNFITAGVQAAAAMAGYLIARVPYPIFFGAVTFVFALIPAVGAAIVVLSAAGILILTGHPYFALFLGLWGIVVVGLVDNLVRPMLIKGDAELDGAVVFFALMGGVLAFGTLGLIIGPLVVAMFLALLRMYHRDLRHSPRAAVAKLPLHE